MTDSERAERAVSGLRLRLARATLGLTQTDVAQAIGIPRTSLSAVEMGVRNVTGLELRRLARLYQRDIAWLLGDEEAPVDKRLIRATESLAEADREQVLRFAEFLAASARREEGSDD